MEEEVFRMNAEKNKQMRMLGRHMTNQINGRLRSNSLTDDRSDHLKEEEEARQGTIVDRIKQVLTKEGSSEEKDKTDLDRSQETIKAQTTDHLDMVDKWRETKKENEQLTKSLHKLKTRAGIEDFMNEV